jgi:hypothetical protein
VTNIGAYSLFVDCVGKSTAACVDVGRCGVEENRVYVAAPGCHTWKVFPPWWVGGTSQRVYSISPEHHFKRFSRTDTKTRAWLIV